MTIWTGVSVVTRPAADPVTVADLKSRLRIDYSDDDALLPKLISGAVARIDGPKGIGFAMIEQTWRKSMDCFPHTILLPGAPIKSIASITYVDAEGATQVLDPSDFREDFDCEPGRVEPAFGKAWPATQHVIGAVKVDYVLGESDPANVPADLIDAVCLLVGHRYEHREAVATGNMASVPLGFESIVNEYRRGTVAA